METRNVELHVAVFHRFMIPTDMVSEAALRGRRRDLERLARQTFKLLGNGGGQIQVVAAFDSSGQCIYEQ